MSNSSISRRSFLGKAAAVSAVTVASASILSSCKESRVVASNEELGLLDFPEQAPDGKPLRTGLIGCGNRGTGAALNHLAAGPNIQLVALADMFEDKVLDCKRKLADHKVEIDSENCHWGFDAYKKLLAMDLDIIILATPPHFRPEHLKACIEAGKHVFMEKPACVDPIGARSIMATSKKAAAIGLSIVAGTQRRHRPDYAECFKQVESGLIGDITSARAWWLQTHVWFRTREEGWTDMEYMLRNWNNFSWLCGDHILDTHVHNIDIVNWFIGRHPESAIGFGGRARRLTGDQYDYFSIDFDFGKGVHSQSMSRQIDDCANSMGEMVVGTKGYTNCKNKIYNSEGDIIWEYEYPKDKDGKSLGKPSISPYVQEHIHLVTAIRTNKPIQEAERCAMSTLTAIMGRTAAYTGQKVTWENMMGSVDKLGPENYVMADVDMEFNTPLPGSQHKS